VAAAVSAIDAAGEITQNHRVPFMETPPIPVVPPKMTMQKLVTIYLDNSVYAKGKVLVGNFPDKHGAVEEHLAPQLAEGWRVVSMHGFGGAAENTWARGWLAVVLEKSTT
jgi:hypothetical protein